jgi:hypothetical protein
MGQRKLSDFDCLFIDKWGCAWRDCVKGTFSVLDEDLGGGFGMGSELAVRSFNPRFFA